MSLMATAPALGCPTAELPGLLAARGLPGAECLGLRSVPNQAGTGDCVASHGFVRQLHPRTLLRTRAGGWRKKPARSWSRRTTDWDPWDFSSIAPSRRKILRIRCQATTDCRINVRPCSGYARTSRPSAAIPNNVTLAGTSAGADSVGLHMVSTGSAGLFHRAIIESGMPTIRRPSHAESAPQGDDLANALGCADRRRLPRACECKNHSISSCRRCLCPRRSYHAAGSAFTGTRSSTASSFPISRACSSQAGQFHQVPTIVGFTRDEGAGFVPWTFPAGVTLEDRSVGG